MRKDWNTTQFEECLDRVVYTNKIQRKAFLDAGKFPIISQEQDFINGYWDNQEDLFKISKPVVIFGDHTQVLKYVDFDFVLGADGVKILMPKSFINSRYLYYFLQNIDLKSLGYARHYRLLKEIEVAYPKSLTEQQNIVAIIDEVYDAIDKTKKNAEHNLNNAKEMFTSYLQSVFEKPQTNWEVCDLNTYIKLIDYRGRTPKKTQSGVRLITAKNVKLGYLQLEPQEFIASENYESWMSRGIPNNGDVIFTTEAPLANVAQINTTEKLAFAQRIIVMQPNKNKLDQTFLKYMLLSNPIRSKILENGTGATVLGIKSSLLKKVQIYFPKSIEEQQEIVRKLNKLSDDTNKLQTVYKNKLSSLEELKKSVLKKAFNGELKHISEGALV